MCETWLGAPPCSGPLRAPTSPTRPAARAQSGVTERTDRVMHLRGHDHAGNRALAQVGELGLVGQAPVPEQERRGLERALVRQLLRVVPAIDQAAVLAVDESDLGLAQRDPL